MHRHWQLFSSTITKSQWNWWAEWWFWWTWHEWYDGKELRSYRGISAQMPLFYVTSSSKWSCFDYFTMCLCVHWLNKYLSYLRHSLNASIYSKQVAPLLQRGCVMLCVRQLLASTVRYLERSLLLLLFQLQFIYQCIQVNPAVVFDTTMRLLSYNSSSSPVKNKLCRTPASSVNSLVCRG